MALPHCNPSQVLHVFAKTTVTSPQPGSTYVFVRCYLGASGDVRAENPLHWPYHVQNGCRVVYMHLSGVSMYSVHVAAPSPQTVVCFFCPLFFAIDRPSISSQSHIPFVCPGPGLPRQRKCDHPWCFTALSSALILAGCQPSAMGNQEYLFDICQKKRNPKWKPAKWAKTPGVFS